MSTVTLELEDELVSLLRQSNQPAPRAARELLVLDAHLHRRPPPELVRAGRPDGLRLLREDGWMKVRQGTTTVDEVVTCTAV